MTNNVQQFIIKDVDLSNQDVYFNFIKFGLHIFTEEISPRLLQIKIVNRSARLSIINA